MHRTVISVSDIRTFLSCRQKWHWYSRNGEHLRSRHPSKHLFLGSIMHEALAAYYKRQMFKSVTDKVPPNLRDKMGLPTPINALVTALENRTEIIRKDLYGDLPEAISEYAHLAQRMLEQYQRWAPSVDKFKVIDVEYELAVDYTYWLFIGFIDAIVQLPDGTYWLLEHKTASREPDLYELFFSLQASGYMWAAQRDPVLSQLDIKGVIYNILLKTEVKPPKVLKSGKLSKDKRQATSVEMYRQAIADNELNPADYEQFILGIDPNRYNKRKYIVPTPAMIDWFDDTIRAVGMEMCKSPVIYPAQARDCSWCDFKLLCTWVRNGLDWRSIVNAQFVERSSPDAESLKELANA